MSGTYVIAGGSHGIGLELVRMLAPTADQIDVWSRTSGDLPSAATIRHLPCDFADPEGPLPELPEEIHGAVYCPGSINLRSFRSLQPADFRQDLELNLLGAVRFLQACQPRLKGPDGGPMHASVASAKAAVEGLMRSLAAEWAPKIRVNAIAPALIDTPLAARLLSSPDKREALAARYPLKRIGEPADVASLARFLLSAESGWMTGQVFGVDGGMSTLRT